MFGWLKKLDAQDSGLTKSLQEFERMLGDGRHVFDAAASAYLGAADPDVVAVDLICTDKEINRRERQIRREIIVHATVFGPSSFSTALVLMAITKDAERIGDYAKNILDLATYRPKKKGSPYFDQLVRLKSDISKMLSDTRTLYGAQDDAAAPAFIERAEILKDECDDAIEEILRAREEQAADPGDPAATALCFRYFKRVISHARNIVTSIVVPVDRLDYFDESKETRDDDPPVELG